MKTLFALIWLSVAALAGAQGLSVRSPFYVAEILKPPTAAGGAPEFPTSGLIHYWTLDESSGSRVDSVGGNNLTDIGTSVGSTTGKDGDCAVFDNAADNLRSSSSLAGPPTSISCALWGMVGTGAALQLLFDYGGDAFVKLSVRNGGNAVWNVNEEGASCIIPSLSVDTWHLIVVTFSGGTSKAYVDGSLIDTQSPGDMATVLSFEILRSSGTSNADEISIWNRAITAEEVTDIWNGGAGTFLP